MSHFTLQPDVAETLEHKGLEFLARFLGAALEGQPRNLVVLGELANVLTQLGRYEEGLAMDRRLVTEAPRDPLARYNLACSLALLARPEEALAELEEAVRLGYDDADFLQGDDDLVSLRDDPRFLEIVRRLEAGA